MYYLVQYTAGYQDFEQGPHIFRGMPFNIVLVFFFVLILLPDFCEALGTILGFEMRTGF